MFQQDSYIFSGRPGCSILPPSTRNVSHVLSGDGAGRHPSPVQARFPHTFKEDTLAQAVTLVFTPQWFSLDLCVFMFMFSITLLLKTTSDI